MLSYKFEVKEQDTWERLSSWVRPFTDGITLDESLDSGSFQLSLIERAEPIKPFTRLRITVFQDDVEKDVLNWLVFNDQVTLRCMGALKLYDHNIQMIELTKMLERDICDSMTVTNSLIKPFEAISVSPIITLNPNLPKGLEVEQSSTYYKTPISLGVETIRHLTLIVTVDASNVIPKPGDDAYMPRYDRYGYCKVTSPTGETVFYTTDYLEDGKVDFNKYGEWKIEYKFAVIYFNANGIPFKSWHDNFFKYSIFVLKNEEDIHEWTITDVVKRLLSAGTTRRVSIGSGEDIDKQKYVFDAEQAEKYSKVLSPEFFFTRSTLFEALMTVGGYIHAIPRLVDNNGVLTVRFDELGGDEQYGGKLTGMMYEDVIINADEYCGGLDSPVQNLLNTRDRIQGAITEPDRDLYKTVRTEEVNVEISADSMIISTEFPIYQIVKVECGYVNSSQVAGDISSYIYEAAEYDTLSSYWGLAYPYSKAYALRYAQGDNKITGLNFRIQSDTTVGTAFNNYAIYNILKAKGITLPAGFNYINLAFRVTYIPIVNSRVVEKKEQFDKHYMNNTLIYNQAGNTVECEFYGNRMKGVIARIGNTVYRRTYEFTNYDDIPKCGQIVDGMYVAVVERSFDITHVKVTLTLTPNFNKLAEFVGVNSNYRLYDISEKQSVDRYVNYGETCLITKYGVRDTRPLINNKGARSYIKMFRDGEASGPDITAATLYAAAGREKPADLVPINRISLPVIAFPLGNSLTFMTQYKDNYGAGYQSTDDYENEGARRVQKLVRYTDAMGNLSVLFLQFGRGLWTASYADQLDGGNANIYPDITHLGTFDPAKNPIPAMLEEVMNDVLLSTGAIPFDISKDSRERLIIVYQIHHQVAEENIVIGPMLTQRNPLIGGYKGVAGKLYFLPKKINSLDGLIDLTDAVEASTKISDIADVYGANIEIAGFKNNTSMIAQSWALVDEATSRLYIGENLVVRPGGYTDALYFNFMDNAALEKFETA